MLAVFTVLAYRAIGGRIGVVVALDVAVFLAAWATRALSQTSPGTVPGDEQETETP